MSMWLCIRKGYGVQHFLQMILETWKKATDKKIKRLEHYWKIYLKHLFARAMIYWLLTFMQMISTYSPLPNCSEIKVHFWTNFPTHFTLSFSTFTRVWLEKAPISFYGFTQISKTYPCYFFSTYREKAFENVARP